MQRSYQGSSRSASRRDLPTRWRGPARVGGRQQRACWALPQNSADRGGPLDEHAVVDEETPQPVAQHDRFVARQASLRDECLDRLLHGATPLDAYLLEPVFGGKHAALDQFVGAISGEITKVGDFHGTGVPHRVCRGRLFHPALYRLGGRHLLGVEEAGRLQDAHSGSPNIRESIRTSASRYGRGPGVWIMPSVFRCSVTAGSSSNGRSQLPSKYDWDSGRRGRWPPASGSSAGYPTSCIHTGTQVSGTPNSCLMVSAPVKACMQVPSPSSTAALIALQIAWPVSTAPMNVTSSWFSDIGWRT